MKYALRRSPWAGDRQPAGLVADVRQLDLDHLGAEHPERRRGLRPLHEKADLDDPHALERCHGRGRRRTPCIPPSTARAMPVVALAAGDARYRIVSATSAADTSRPDG